MTSDMRELYRSAPISMGGYGTAGHFSGNRHGPDVGRHESEQDCRRNSGQLANPKNSLASLAFKNQFRTYAGNLPGAADQGNYTLLFQPVFPFGLEPRQAGVGVRPIYSSGLRFRWWSISQCRNCAVVRSHSMV